MTWSSSWLGLNSHGTKQLGHYCSLTCLFFCPPAGTDQIQKHSALAVTDRDMVLTIRHVACQGDVAVRQSSHLHSVDGKGEVFA